MASYTFLLIILSLLTFSHQFLITKSDDSLIENICSKTPEPVLCQNCLNGNSSSKTADARGLAVISIHCGEYDADQLFRFVFNSWLNTSNSQAELKLVLNNCSSQTLLGRYSFHGVVVAIEKGSLNWRSYAIDRITRGVSQFLNGCLDTFHKHPNVALPEYVLTGTNAVNQDISIILGILNNIS